MGRHGRALGSRLGHAPVGTHAVGSAGSKCGHNWCSTESSGPQRGVFATGQPWEGMQMRVKGKLKIVRYDRTAGVCQPQLSACERPEPLRQHSALLRLHCTHPGGQASLLGRLWAPGPTRCCQLCLLPSEGTPPWPGLALLEPLSGTTSPKALFCQDLIRHSGDKRVAVACLFLGCFFEVVLSERQMKV